MTLIPVTPKFVLPRFPDKFRKWLMPDENPFLMDIEQAYYFVKLVKEAEKEEETNT